VSLCADSETDLTVQICCVWTEAGVIPGIGGVRGHRRGVERSRGSVSPLVALPGISVTQKTGTEQSSGTLALVLRTELIGKREEVQPRVASRAQHVCRGLLQPATYEAVQRQGSRGRGPEAGHTSRHISVSHMQPVPEPEPPMHGAADSPHPSFLQGANVALYIMYPPTNARFLKLNLQ
jgi:hypothetical protein